MPVAYEGLNCLGVISGSQVFHCSRQKARLLRVARVGGTLGAARAFKVSDNALAKRPETLLSPSCWQLAAKTRLSKDAVHYSLVIVILDGAPVVHRRVNQIHNLLNACSLSKVGKKPVLHALQYSIRTLTKARKL